MSEADLYHDAYQPMGKSGITLEEYRGKFRIRVPARLTGASTIKAIYTRLNADDWIDQCVACRAIKLMEQDIDDGVFDVTLVKYQFPKHTEPSKLTLATV